MNTGHRSALAALVVSVLAIMASGLAAAPGAAKQPASLAKLLAADVANARTNAQRYRAVLRVMQELHVPVFTAAGKQLVSGARGLPRTFNLYDFQLHAVADAFDRTIGAEEFARLLSSGGTQVSAGAARSTLLRGVRAAVARSSSPASTVGLLVRELGLRHRPASDLARDLPTGRLTLDPLQTLLVIADSSVRTSRARVLASTARTGDSPCEQSASPLERLLGVAGVPIGPALPIWKLVSLHHQLTLSTAVRRLQGAVSETHYGPPGHAPLAGRRLKMGIHAEITADFPDDIKCGYFAGDRDTLPPKGPLRGAQIAWSYTGTFEQHFPSGNKPERTDANGNAVIELGVRSEKFPGFGTVVRRKGTIVAEVFPNSRSDPVAISQPWAVEFHQPLGFKFSGLKWRLKLCCDGSDFAFATYEITHARKCGGDPFASDWAVILHEVADWPGGGGPGYKHDGPVSGHWTPGGQIAFSGPGFGPTPVINLTQTNGQLQASAAGSEPDLTILNGGPVTVEEDRDNGAFTWSCSQVTK